MSLKILKLFIVLIAGISVLATGYQYVVQKQFLVLTESQGAILYNDVSNEISKDTLECEWATNEYVFFSGNVFSQLIYYSHLIPLISVLFLSIFIFSKVGLTLTTKPLLILSTSFSIWCLLDLFLWSSDIPEQIMFAWALLMPIEYIVYYSTLSLHYTLVTGKTIGNKFKAWALAIFAPIALFLSTSLTLTSFNYTNCDREALEGVMWTYLYAFEILTIILIVITTIHTLSSKNSRNIKRNILLTLGTFLFLMAFMLGNIAGTFSEDWSIAQYGLLGMPVFLAFIGYLIIEYKMFNVGVFAAQGLVVAVWFLVGSIIFVARTPQTLAIVTVTLVLLAIVGFILIRSVRREVQQRQQIEGLAQSLAVANERLKELDKAKSEFVSIASHQLRSPLTAIRGYASMLAEGSFGQMPAKALEAAKRIEESTKLMAMSIEDYLNVSRIESGNMKYNLSDFNLLEMTSKICDDLRPEALKQNLILLFRSDIKSKGLVNADVGKAHQIIHNLINNSIKYTQKGSISVFVREDIKAKRIYIDISDTGIGMSQKTIDSLFQKFSRADNANSVNTSGTGLGLYVAVKMAEAMNGSISASSEGDAKGSTFTFELPLAM